MKPKRLPKTIKEKKFIKEYIANGGNGVRAAAKVYDVSSYASANQIARENLQKLSIAEVLNKAGVTDEKIALTLNNGMEANKPISAVAGKDASEASVDFIDVPDWQARLKATELASKLKGHLKDNVGGEITLKHILVTRQP